MRLIEILKYPESRELERSLQISSGAAWIAIATTLMAAWGTLPDDIDLRLSLIRSLSYFGFAFLMAMASTGVRLSYHDDDVQRSELARLCYTFVWSGFATASAVLLIFAGAWTISSFVESTKMEANPNFVRFDEWANKIDERLRRLEDAVSEVDRVGPTVTPPDGNDPAPDPGADGPTGRGGPP